MEQESPASDEEGSDVEQTQAPRGVIDRMADDARSASTLVESDDARPPPSVIPPHAESIFDLGVRHEEAKYLLD